MARDSARVWVREIGPFLTSQTMRMPPEHKQPMLQHPRAIEIPWCRDPPLTGQACHCNG